MITRSFETRFGSAKHFIANICDGEDNSNNEYENILDQCFGKYSKLEAEENHLTKYALMYLILIPEYCNINDNYTSLKWNYRKLNNFKQCTQLYFQW